MELVAAIILGVCALLSIGLVIFCLPGIWMLLLSMILLDLWQPNLVPLWAHIAVGFFAIWGEVVDFVAGAVGSKFAGGSRRAGVGAIIGTIIGAIAGTGVFPIVGTVVGAAVGAGAGAALFELTKTREPDPNVTDDNGEVITDNPSIRATKVAVGAATGRLVATVVKIALSSAAAMVAIVGLFF